MMHACHVSPRAAVGICMHLLALLLGRTRLLAWLLGHVCSIVPYTPTYITPFPPGVVFQTRLFDNQMRGANTERYKTSSESSRREMFATPIFLAPTQYIPTVERITSMGKSAQQGGGGYSLSSWSELYDHRPSHLSNAGTEHVGISPTRQTSLVHQARSGVRCSASRNCGEITSMEKSAEQGCVMYTVVLYG